jgi:hypothetical protein
MNAFHRIAGVQDASRSDAASPPPHPAVVADPPSKDDARSLYDGASARRSSIPLSRRPSQKSLRSMRSGRTNRKSRNASYTDLNAPPKLSSIQGDFGPPTIHTRASVASFPGRVRSQLYPPPTNDGHGGSRDGDEEGDEDEDDGDGESDFEWGPQHPCFPHPNPHCAPDTAEADATRVIRIKRDYLIAGDLFPQFANLYPEILDPLVTDSEFRELVVAVNAVMQHAFSPYTARAWVDAILGVVTGYAWDDLGFTGAKRGEKELESLVDWWNQGRDKEGREVQLVQPRRTGYMSLDFVVPDPGIDTVLDEDEDEDEDAAEMEETNA